MIGIVPCTISDARCFVGQFHRHHPAPVGGLFAAGCSDGERIVGVVIVGRPTARRLQDGWTCEVTRLCVLEGFPNACSMLYRAAWRGARALGWRRLVTFTLATERGGSLRGAGFVEVARTGGKSWSVPSRPRVDKHPLQERIRWEVSA